MGLDPQTLEAMLDELESIEKEASIGGLFRPLGGALSGAFRGGLKGIQNIGRAATGTVTRRGGQIVQMAGPKRKALAMAGLKQLAPAAAVAVPGALATYGAGKAAFGD